MIMRTAMVSCCRVVSRSWVSWSSWYTERSQSSITKNRFGGLRHAPKIDTMFSCFSWLNGGTAKATMHQP
jgi:hypothetical protein